MAEKTYRISGRVVDSKSRAGIAGLRVEAWDKELIFDDFVGNVDTDAAGFFQIEFSETYFLERFLDRRPDLYFKVYQAQALLHSTEDSLLWNIASELTDMTIEVDAETAVVDAGRYTVVGTVASPDRAGVGGLRVQIVDKNIGQDVPLAETATDERGSYQISFAAPSLREQRKMRPDLQARVYTSKTFLAASDVRYNASTYETLHVRLPANATALPSEHETLTGALSVHYQGKLSDLKEADDQQDITYLANKTGWDARAVALAALADQFSRQRVDRSDGAGAAGIPVAFYYALFRAGLPANADTLYHADAGTVEQVWQRAIEQGVIPNALERELPRAVLMFQRLSAQKMLTGPALAGASSLKAMLTASRLDDAQQRRFAELYAAHQTDMPAFWQAIGAAFGKHAADRLQLDGKMGFLTLNNAPLMQELHQAAGKSGLGDPLELAQQGYHRATQWSALLASHIPVPNEIPGDTPAAKRANYADYLAAQVRLSYPTASVAQMVKSGDLPLTGAAEGVPGQVHAFLTEHQGKFELGVQPVQQYIARNKLTVADEIVTQVQRLQRVFQITPSDQAMIGLMKRGVDAAYHVVRYDKEAFVTTFQADLGGTDAALRTYDMSVQVHNAVLNIALSYLTAKNGPVLGAQPLKPGQPASDSAGQILQPAPKSFSAENAGDVIASPTLEKLFGEMDFCACDHCRSILSPAAYLVDLLLFIDNPTAGTQNPQTVLLERRPDLQHLPLTCENTNTALPYIDVVNETLEYFVANAALNSPKLSLDGYIGHDTGGAATGDLLASPQYVNASAYTILQGQRFPAPLPFHQPLENLRRYFDTFGAPLPLAMERLRKSDVLDVDRSTNPPPPLGDYGWRDILIEEIGLSRAEHEILTDSNAVPLWRLYGFPDKTADAAVIAALLNAKQFTRRVGITYEEIVAILQTRFVNPNSVLIPKLERLGVSFAALQALKDRTLSDAAFDTLLPKKTGAIDVTEFGGDKTAWEADNHNTAKVIRNWLNTNDIYAKVMSLITLTGPTANSDPCDFDQLEFRYAQPRRAVGAASMSLGAAEFVRLLRFIRLWKKLGWTIEQTDAAICALLPLPSFPQGANAIDTVAKLDSGFRTLLPRLGIVARVMRALNLTPRRDLLPLLACWSEIGTHGDGALYRQMFLNPALLKQDAVFADNGYGEFLADRPHNLVNNPFPAPTKKLADHAEALRSAFNLTGDEYDQIAAALGYGASTPLTIPNISAIFRRGYLARTLRLSVRELLLLMQLTGLDPFALPDPTDPAILRLIALVQALKDGALKSAAALYLIWNQDLSGKSAPDPAQVIEFARTLRSDFASIEDQFAATEDPGGDIARTRMTLVYGQETADAFFAFLDDTIVLDMTYTHPTSTLQLEIIAADSNIAYDDFRHRLSHTGVMTTVTRDALLHAVPNETAEFQAAVNALFAGSEDAKGSFFTRYPELKPLYDAYTASADPPATKRSALLAAFRPELSRKRKRQQALQRVSAAAAVDLAFTQTLLDAPVAPYALHAAGHAGQPALDDVLALETPGLAAQFFANDAGTGTIIPFAGIAANLDYAHRGSNPLPANPSPGAAISGIWSGQVETPEAGFYNFVIEVDSGATVELTLDGQACPLTQNGNIYRNTDPLELKAGMLYDLVLKVEKVKDTLRVKWETPKRAREVIPARYLYPPTILAPFSDAYIRFLKASALATTLGLTANELAHFATHADYRIDAQGQIDSDGQGWLNALPNADNLHLLNPADAANARTLDATLLTPLRALLDYARIKAAISPGDESLLTVLQDPDAATANADSLLFTLTRWNQTSLNDLLAQLGGTSAGLAHFDQFSRVYDAFALIQKIGISAKALIQATTNEPGGDRVRDLQAALRARYAAADWRAVVQPINDAMRGLQRDALVASILHQMRESDDPNLVAVDTADKLFEYFLMDVQMEPCMQTSRIRHALSSVQLFIERCLMNLEPPVSLSPNQAKQWEWMKRYRVWEANRKVFLFPENWLEPELRDDKSPFFKEIESELLQSDITEDSAATALLNYLSKLEEVAKLEPCGIYHDEVKDRDHVIARTAGAHRKYYYRRYEDGSWTPWEQVPLDIEDNPVIPYVWNDRLLLFWLRILKQGPVDPNALSTSPITPDSPVLANLSLGAIQTDAKSNAQSNVKVTVQALLCWSEYYNGKWQPTKTSDVSRPGRLGNFDPHSSGSNPFNRSEWNLSVWEKDDALWIIVGLSGNETAFRFYNTHSLPVYIQDEPNEFTFFGEEFFLDHVDYRVLDMSRATKNLGPFVNVYYRGLTRSLFNPDVCDESLQHTVLQPDNRFGLVEPRHPLQRPFHAPFFFEDSRHVFYVTTTEQQKWMRDYSGYGIAVNPGATQAVEIPGLILQATQVEPKLRGVAGSVGPVSSAVGSGPMRRFITEDAYIRQGIDDTGSVIYAGRQIGPAGAISIVRAGK